MLQDTLLLAFFVGSGVRWGRPGDAAATFLLARGPGLAVQLSRMWLSDSAGQTLVSTSARHHRRVFSLSLKHHLLSFFHKPLRPAA